MAIRITISLKTKRTNERGELTWGNRETTTITVHVRLHAWLRTAGPTRLFRSTNSGRALTRKQIIGAGQFVSVRDTSGTLRRDFFPPTTTHDPRPAGRNLPIFVSAILEPENASASAPAAPRNYWCQFFFRGKKN